MSTDEVLIFCIDAFICAEAQNDVTFILKGSLGRTRTISDHDASGDEIEQTVGTDMTFERSKML